MQSRLSKAERLLLELEMQNRYGRIVNIASVSDANLLLWTGRGSEMGDLSTELRSAVDNLDANPYRVLWLYVQATLAHCGGNQSAAARRLGMHRRTLQRIIERRYQPDARP